MADSIVNQWVQIIRCARLSASTTAVALDLATYANRDGTRVFPGVARVALDCELSAPTVKRALRRLRALGLIEQVGRRPGTQVTEYRLKLPPLHELREHVEVPWPHEYDAMIAARNKAWRNPAWRANRADHQRAAQSDVQITGELSVQITSDGGPSIDPPRLNAMPITSKTIPRNGALVSARASDDGMALNEKGSP